MRDPSTGGMPKRDLLELTNLYLRYGVIGELGYGYSISRNGDTDNPFLEFS